MNQPHADTPAVQELNQLFREGVERGLWEGNKSDFARKIGVDRTKVRLLLSGERPDTEVSSVSASVRALIEDGVSPKASTEFNRLFLSGKQQGKWDTLVQCGEELDISADTVQKFRNAKPETFGARTRNLYKAVLAKLKRQVGARGADAVALSPAEQPTTPSPVEKPEATPDIAAVLSRPFVERVDRLEAKLPALIRDAVSHVPQHTSHVDAAPEGVIASPWADEVLAGRMAIAEQKLPGVRFVLTKDTFHRLRTQFTREEVADTKGLAGVIADAVAELRRRLTLVAQQESEGAREDVATELASQVSKVVRELVALAITLEEVQTLDLEEGLIRAARHFKELDIFSSQRK